MKIMASGPFTSWQTDGEKVETVTDFTFLGSKSLLDGDCTHRIKRCLLCERKAMTNVDSILKQRHGYTYILSVLKCPPISLPTPTL